MAKVLSDLRAGEGYGRTPDIEEDALESALVQILFVFRTLPV